MEQKTRCILCGGQMSLTPQKNPSPRDEDEPYVRGSPTNQFCTKCRDRDLMERIQALIRTNKLNTAKNIYKNQAIRFEKTNQQMFDKWVHKVIITANKDFKGYEYVVDKLKEIEKEVQSGINSKIRRRIKYNEYIRKYNLTKNLMEPTERAQKLKEVKRMQKCLKTELKQEFGRFNLPKEVKINADG